MEDGAIGRQLVLTFVSLSQMKGSAKVEIVTTQPLNLVEIIVKENSQDTFRATKQIIMVSTKIILIGYFA